MANLYKTLKKFAKSGELRMIKFKNTLEHYDKSVKATTKKTISDNVPSYLNTLNKI